MLLRIDIVFSLTLTANPLTANRNYSRFLICFIRRLIHCYW